METFATLALLLLVATASAAATAVAAAATCAAGDGIGCSDAGRALLQASKASSHEILGGKLSEVAEKMVQGLDVNLGNVGKYVESLADSVAGHNYTMNKAENEAVAAIGQMIVKIEKDMLMGHAEDQREVNRMRDLIQNCSSDATAGLGSVAGLKTTVDSSRVSHATCRSSEGIAKDAKDLACAAYDSHRKSSTPPSCFPTQLTADYLQAAGVMKQKQMETCLESLQGWLSPLYQKYDNCKSKSELHKNLTDDCGTKQSSFEAAFCSYESKLEDTCDAQTRCRTRHVNARNATHTDVRIAEAARKADFDAGKRTICFLSVLSANNTHKMKTLLECKRLKVNTSQFNIVYPGIPSATDCVTEKSAPCDNDWTKQNYESQPWFAKSQMKNCSSCPVPATTTTTQQTTITTTTPPGNSLAATICEGPKSGQSIRLSLPKGWWPSAGQKTNCIDLAQKQRINGYYQSVSVVLKPPGGGDVAFFIHPQASCQGAGSACVLSYGQCGSECTKYMRPGGGFYADGSAQGPGLLTLWDSILGGTANMDAVKGLGSTKYKINSFTS